MHTTIQTPAPADSVSTRDLHVPATAFGGRVRIDARGERLWRVSTESFAVIGHVELVDTANGRVFVAKRYSPAHTRFVDRGRFWSMDDALECLWYSV